MQTETLSYELCLLTLFPLSSSHFSYYVVRQFLEEG